MKTEIFKIEGGGEKVRETVQFQRHKPVTYTREISDLPERLKLAGQNFFTGQMWSTSLETLQKWANEWAGEDVTLFEEASTK